MNISIWPIFRVSIHLLVETDSHTSRDSFKVFHIVENDLSTTRNGKASLIEGLVYTVLLS